MLTLDLKIEPNEIVNYSDFQFGNLDGARLDHVKVHSFGLYAVLDYKGRNYVVPYNRLEKVSQ